MINKIWGLFIVSGLLYSVLTGNAENISNQIVLSAENSFNMTLKIFPTMALWLGIMNIVTTSGLLKKITKLLTPLIIKIFPEIPKNHESIGLITSTIIANLLGLGNASTPFGLKTMKSLQTLNHKKDTATNSMVTFLVLNTTGLTIIPTTIISMRIMYESTSPTSIILPCIISSLIATIFGLIIDKILRRKDKNDIYI